MLGGRKVDLPTPQDLSIYFRQEVVETAEVQYAAWPDSVEIHAGCCKNICRRWLVAREYEDFLRDLLDAIENILSEISNEKG